MGFVSFNMASSVSVNKLKTSTMGSIILEPSVPLYSHDQGSTGFRGPR